MRSSSAGKIVTFYSYKGGTGRSMALANVAWVLASTGARVLVIDWDLEAPGLHRYFRPFLADKELVRDESEGVIDFMVGFAERMATPDTLQTQRDDRWVEKHADISKWSKQLLWPSGEDAETRLGGSIHFVPAGRQGPAYARRVNSFDWSGFYQKYSGGAFIDAMRRSMASFDWVLIDSRTGVSDTSGICTMQLPDILVVCFTLNYQSIDGAAAVAASARDGRKDTLRVLPLPTRIDGSEDKLLRSMLAYARDLFDPLMPPDIDRPTYWRAMGIPYFPRYAYAEKLAPFEEQVSDTTSTLPAVERLTSYITSEKISKLEPLPEPHRSEALAEFEQLPWASFEAEPVATAPAKTKHAPLWFRRAWYWGQKQAWQLAAVGIGVAVILFQFQLNRSGQISMGSAGNPSVIPSLLTAAVEDLDAGRRAQGALLIAEAAGRLDPATVVGPEGEPGRRLHEALMKLSPLVIDAVPRSSVQISPDGQWLVATSPKQETSLLRFPPNGKQAGTPLGYSVAAFSPDSRYLASGGRDGSLAVVETASGRRIWQWENVDPDSAWVTAVAFAPSGALLAAGTDTGSVVIAQVDPWKELKRFVQKGAVDRLVFSLDSMYLATASRAADRVTWWSPTSDRPVEILASHKGGVADMVFVPPGPLRGRRMVTAAGDGTVREWTQTEGVAKQLSLEGPATVLAVSPDGSQLASGGLSGSRLPAAFVRPTEGEMAGAPSGVFTGRSNAVRAMTFERDGSALFVVDDGGQIITWRLNQTAGSQLAQLQGTPTALALSPDGRYLAVAGSSGVHVILRQRDAGADRGSSVGPTFSALEAKGLACSQADQPQLPVDAWKKYFGDEPLRYTCEVAAPVSPSSLR